MSELYLCLLDCSSIQSYVFGSNQLKSNVGASTLVERIYEAADDAEKPAQGFVYDVLQELFNEDSEGLQQWRVSPEQIALQDSASHVAEIGYIGGGNALLLFRSAVGADPAANAKDFVRQWTRKLLIAAPGIEPAIAISGASNPPTEQQLEKLFDELKRMKNSFKPATTLPRHGITRKCSYTNFSVDGDPPNMDNDGKYISSVVAAKNDNLPITQALNQFKGIDLSKIGGLEDYIFGLKLDSLGQNEGAHNHIAVVHIDGNDMGRLFAEKRQLTEKRQLANAVNQRSMFAMHQMLTALSERIDDLVTNGDLKPFWRKDLNKKILPVRPLVLSGDDCTFVCDARLSFFLAEVYIQAFNTGPNDDLAGEFSSCAGVAITGTKYPFYRTYELAEALCASAKTKAVKDSWLDFHVALSGMSGGLEELRQRQYTIGDKSLLCRPFCLGSHPSEISWQAIKSAIKHFRDREWPENKIKDLREALVRGEEATRRSVVTARSRNLHLPKIGSYDSAGWDAGKTPYYDIIELMSFYPPSLF